MKPGGFKLNLGGIGSGGGWGVSDAETPYHGIAAAENQNAAATFKVLESKKDDNEFDGELMPPSDDEYNSETDDEVNDELENRRTPTPTPDQQGNVSVTTYKAHDAAEDDDDADTCGTFVDHGSNVSATPPTYPDSKPPTAPPATSVVHKDPKLPPLSTSNISRHSDPNKNHGILPGGFDSGRRGAGSNASSSRTAGGGSTDRGLRTVEVPNIREVKAKSGSKAPPTTLPEFGGKPNSRNAMQREPSAGRGDSEEHAGDWAPGHIAGQLKVPFDVRAMTMGDGNKEVWTAIGDDPISSFNLVGSDLQQNVQINGVTHVRSLAIVEAVETKIGFGRAPRLNRKTSLNGELKATSSVGNAAASAALNGGNTKFQRGHSSQGLASSKEPSPEPNPKGEKVTNLWCGLENGRIAIVNLFYNSEDGMIDHAHQGRVSMLFTSPTGSVWSSGADKYLKIWDPSSRRCTFTKFASKPVTEIIAVTSKKEIWTSSMSNSITLWEYDGKEAVLPGGKDNYRNTHKTASDIRCLKYHAASDSVWISLSQSVSLVSNRFRVKGKIGLIANGVEFVNENRVVAVAHGTAISKNQDHIVVYSMTTSDNITASPHCTMGPFTQLSPQLLFVGDPLEGITKVGLRFFPGEEFLIAPHTFSSTSEANSSNTTSIAVKDRCVSVFTHDYMQPVGSWGIPPEILKQVEERAKGETSLSSSAVIDGRTDKKEVPKADDSTSTSKKVRDDEKPMKAVSPPNPPSHTSPTEIISSPSAQLDPETKEMINSMNRCMKEMESDVKNLRLRQPAVVDFGRLTNLTMQMQFEFRRILEDYPLEPAEVTTLNHLYESQEGRDAAANLLRMKKAMQAISGNNVNTSTAALTPANSSVVQESNDSFAASPSMLKTPVHAAGGRRGSKPVSQGGGGDGPSNTVNATTTNLVGGFDPMILLKQQERQSKARDDRYSDLVKNAHAQATATLERSTILLQGLTRVQTLLEDAASRAAGNNTDFLEAIPTVPEVTVHSPVDELRNCVHQLKALTRFVTEPRNMVVSSAATHNTSTAASPTANAGATNVLSLPPAVFNSGGNVPPGGTFSPAHQSQSVSPAGPAASDPTSPNQSFALLSGAVTGGALPPKPVQFHDRITQCVSFLTIELERVEQFVADIGQNVSHWRIFLSGDAALLAKGGDDEQSMGEIGFMTFEKRRLFQTLELFVDICQAETTLLVCDACAADALDETKETGVVTNAMTPLQHQNQTRIKDLNSKINNISGQLFATAASAREHLMTSSIFKVIPSEAATGLGKGYLAGHLHWLHLFLYFLCDSLEPAEKFVLEAKASGDHSGLIDALDKLSWWTQRLEQIGTSLTSLKNAVSATRKHAEITPSARYDRQRVDRTLLEAPDLSTYFFFLCALGAPDPLDRMMCSPEGAVEDAVNYVDRISEDAENLMMKIDKMTKCCNDISSEDYKGGTLQTFIKKFVMKLPQQS